MTRPPRRALLALLAAAACAACEASTTRPTFGPMPGALTAEVHVERPAATQILADALQADSIQLRRVVERDGVIESQWLAVPGYTVMRGVPLGPGAVRVRAWVDPSKPFHSQYTIEVAYRVFADPSREERELEQPVAETHPARVKVTRLLDRILTQYGDSTAIAEAAQRAARMFRADSARARPDTSGSGGR